MSNNKKTRFLITHCILIFIILAGCAAKISTPPQTIPEGTDISSTLTSLRQKGTLVIGCSNEVPFSYLDLETGEIMGVDGEIALGLSRRLGIAKTELKTIPFENLLLELSAGSIDMIAGGMYINAERSRIALFTDGWYRESDVILIPKDSPFESFSDLAGGSLAAMKGVLFMDMIQQWEAEGRIGQAVMMNTQSDLLLSVNTGKVDACITDSLLGAYLMKNDETLKLKMLADYEPQAAGIVAAAVRLGDTRFCEEINQVLAEMKQDGTLLSILLKYGLTEADLIP